MLDIYLKTGAIDPEHIFPQQLCEKYIPIGGDYANGPIFDCFTALDFLLSAVICDYNITRVNRKFLFGENFRYIGVGYLQDEKDSIISKIYVIMVESVGKKAKDKPLSFPMKIFSEIPYDIYLLISSSKLPITGMKKEQVKVGKKFRNRWILKFTNEDGKEETISKISDFE